MTRKGKVSDLSEIIIRTYLVNIILKIIAEIKFTITLFIAIYIYNNRTLSDVCYGYIHI